MFFWGGVLCGWATVGDDDGRVQKTWVHRISMIDRPPHQPHFKNHQVKPAAGGFRRGVLMGDWNDANILVAPEAPERVVGAIDFGDSTYRYGALNEKRKKLACWLGVVVFVHVDVRTRDHTASPWRITYNYISRPKNKKTTTKHTYSWRVAEVAVAMAYAAVSAYGKTRPVEVSRC